MTTLTTPRLTLRPWQTAEAERLLDIRRRPEVARWLSDPNPWSDVAAARAKIEEWAHKVASDPPFGVWAILPGNADMPAGSVSLNQLPGDDGEVEVGWYLHPDSHGQGYAREAARAVLDRAFAHGIERVWAVMWPDNAPSARVCRALGMADLGVRHDPWYGTEEFPDSQLFRIERPADPAARV